MTKLLKELVLLLREWIQDYWKQNLPHRVSENEKKVTLLQGNSEEYLKRLRAIEKYLQVEYHMKAEYKKK